MRDLVILFIHLLTTAARLAGRGGLRSVVAESVLLKHQLLILNRSRQRAPPLRLSDRLPPDPFRHRSETFDPLAAPPGPEEPKVSPPLLFPAEEEARAKTTWPRTHRCCRPDEAAQSHLGLSAHRSADCPDFRHPLRQGRGAKDSRQS